MDKRTTDVVSYLTWVGLIIAYIMGDRENCKFHMNQSLIICLLSTVSGAIIGVLGELFLIGWIFMIIGIAVEIFCALCVFIGIVNAIQGREEPVPVVGNIQLLK